MWARSFVVDENDEDFSDGDDETTEGEGTTKQVTSKMLSSGRR